MSFAGYLLEAAAPVLAGLLITWGLIVGLSGAQLARAVEAVPVGDDREPPAAALDRWQTAKGLTIASAIVLCFVFTSWPREVVALTGAGVLLMSRKLHPRNMLGLVD